MKTIRVFVSVGPRGAERRASSRIPADSTPAAVRAERERLRVELRKDDPEPLEGFAKDASTYLATKTDMPTYKERVRDIGLWVAEFGSTPRNTITPIMIGTVRARWLTVGPRFRQRWVDDPETKTRVRRDEAIEAPLSASTVNHRLRALENFYTTMNGRHGKNPVRDVAEADEVERPIRAMPIDAVRAIIGTMRDSKSKARLLVEVETGLPHASLMRVTAADFNANRKTLWVPGRRKGKGTPGRTLPLTTRAVAALKMMQREDAWGHFTKSGVRRAWLRACQVAKVKHPPRVYDATRHAFGANTLRLTDGDMWATQRLMGHSTQKLTERYARAQVDPALAAAVAKLQKVKR